MKKIYDLVLLLFPRHLEVFLCRVFALGLLSLFLPTAGWSQVTTLSTTVTPTTPVGGTAFTNNNGTGTLTFNFTNSNPFPVLITSIESVVGIAGPATSQLWYKTTPVSGPPGTISTGNGWTQVTGGNFSFTAVASGTSVVTQPIMTGLTFTIPAGVTYGIAVFGGTTPTAGLRYHTIAAPNLPTVTFTAGGCTLTTGTNIGFAGVSSSPPTTSPATNNRGFVGKIIFEPAGPCTNPPTPGTVSSNVGTNVCPNTPFILSLNGGTGGTGQTFQWESSPNGSTWTPITGATNSTYTGTQVVSTYYRCQVTCGLTVASNSIQLITTATPLSGLYTINPSLPSGSNNYQTWGALAADLTCAGVSGPVTVNVAPGTYTEQVNFPVIPGASAVNTLTMNCTGVTLTFNATVATAPHTLALDGSDYMTFNNLTVEGTGASFALSCHLWNNADYNTFNNCTFNCPANGTPTTQIPFSISGSATSGTTTGLAGAFNIVDNCTMNGGYYGVTLAGSASQGNQITDCNVLDFYLYGVYMLSQTGAKVSGCTIERPNRTTLSTFYGVYVATNPVNITIEKNIIRNAYTQNSANTSSSYPIYVNGDGTPGNENKVVNNLIYNINNNGLVYAIYLLGADYVQCYHNTVAIDYLASTAGAVYGIYNSGTVGGIDIRNNLLYIRKGGTGIKYGLYYTSLIPVSDNNNVYMIPAGTGASNYGYYLAAQPALSNWQSAAGGIWDQNSSALDPLFTDPLLGDFMPTEPALNGTGANVGVTDDLYGMPRSTSPDMGCIEFSVLSNDVGAQLLIAPAVGNGCYSNAETVTVQVRNFGATTVDFANNTGVLQVNVTGATTATLTQILNSGTLAPATTMNITLPATLDMSALGTYTFNAFFTVAGDPNVANDAMNVVTRTKVPLAFGAMTVAPKQLCVSGNSNLTLSGVTGANIQWQASTVGVTGPWTNVGTNSSAYAATGLSQTTYYRAELSCYNAPVYSSVDTVKVNNPQILATQGDTICGYGSLSLTATVSAGATPKWYANPTGGLPVSSGSPFNTPLLSTTTTYYAEANDGLGGSDSVAVPLATGTTTGVYHHMFVVSSPTGMTLSSIGIKCQNPVGTLTDWDIYYRTDNYQTVAGANTSAAGWILLSSVTGVPSLGNTTYTTIASNLALSIPPGATYSLYVAPVGGAQHQYGTPAVGTTVTSNANATIIAGNRGSSLFNCITSGGIAVVNLRYILGCASPRVPVVALVNAGPAFAVTNGATLCNNEIKALQVTTPIGNFTDYSWTPTTDLYTDAAATIPYTGGSVPSGTVYVKRSTPGLVVYTASAWDAVSQCQNIDTTQLTIQPASAAINADSICVSGSTILQLTGINSFIQWQELISGVWTNITGATSPNYTTPSLTATTDYRLVISNSLSSTCLTQVHSAVVNNPTILTTTPATLCGVGSVTLSATSTPNSGVRWYAAPTGGVALATGTTFNTPTISTTTTYYAAAFAGGSAAGSGVAVTMPAQGTTFTGNVRGYFFTAPTNFTITGLQDLGTTVGNQSIAVVKFTGNVPPPVFATVTNAFTVLYLTQNNTNTSIIPVNIPVYAGEVIGILGQRSNVTSYATPTGAISTTIAGMPVTLTRMGMQFPLNTTAPMDLWQETGGAIGRVQITYSIGCEGPRVPVVATVTSPPALTLSSNAETICQTFSTPVVNITSNLVDYDTYSWTPTAGVSGSAASGYAFNPVATTTYTLTASQTGGSLCQNVQTLAVTVNPTPAAPVVAPTALTICQGNVGQLTASGSSYSAQQDLGTGVLTTSATAITPYSSFYEGVRIQYLVLGSELGALGLSAGNITSLAFNVTTVGAYGQLGYTVKLGNTTATALSGFATTTGLATVYGPGATLMIPTLGWNTLTFGTPFYWDGTSNLIVEVCHENDPTSALGVAYGTSSTVTYTNTAFNSVYGNYADNVYACGLAFGTAVTSTNRPNMRFTFDSPAVYSWTPVSGLFTNAAGTAPYTGGPAATVYASPGGTSSYNVVGVGPNGCYANGGTNVTVTVTPPPTADAGNGQTVCGQAAANLSASFGGSATAAVWSGGSGAFSNALSPTATYTPSPSEAGTTVTLTWTTNAPAGCTAASDTVQVQVNAPAVADAGADVSTCATTAVSLGASGTGGWSGGGGAFSLATSPTSTYTPSAGEVGGTVELYWTAPDPDGTGPCASATDSMLVSVNGYSTLVAPPSAAGYLADYEHTDAQSWTHYYDDNGTPANFCDDFLLMSVRDANSGGNAIGTVAGGLQVRVKGAANTVAMTAPTTPYVQGGGTWYVMERFWDVTPVNQPLNDAAVRFYFTAADYASVVAASPYVSSSPAQMAFYKINNGPGGTPSYNPDPVFQHAGVPVASPLSYAGTGYYEYYNGALADTSHWSLGSMGGDYYAEYVVDRFSGGGGGGGMGFAGAFPVELLGFSGHSAASQNFLRWTTASELGNKSFTLLRSVDNVTFELMAEVPSKAQGGNSSVPLDYGVVDDKPAKVTYYRLQSTDLDGGTQLYPKTVELLLDAGTNALLSVYPNPATDLLNVGIAQPEKGRCRVELYDVYGRLVLSERAEVNDGFALLRLDISALAKGTYSVMVKNAQNGTLANTRFVKE